MSFAPYEFLLIVKESAFGTQKAGSVSTLLAAGDAMYIRLAGANRFTPRPTPRILKIPFGGGYAVQGYSVSDRFAIGGQLQVELCYTQAALLLDWGITRINVGQTTPWVTTEPSGDLASCTVYHAVMRMDDSTIKRRRYKGVKIASGALASSADSGLTMLTLNLVAQKMDGNAYDASTDPDATAFPAPADTVFPVDPVLFVQGSGAFLIAASALTYCESANLSWTNTLDSQFFQSHFLALSRLRGRLSKADFKVMYTASPNFRTIYEALTTQALALSWTNTTHTVALTFNGNNLTDPLADDLTPGKLYDQTFSMENQWDTSASQDIGFTFT